MTVEASTLNRKTTTNGGTIATSSSSDWLTINNGKLVNNAANSQGAASVTRDEHAIIAHAGGAIYRVWGVTRLRNRIVAGSRRGGDCAGRLSHNSGNLIESIPVRRALSNCSVTTTHTLNFGSAPGGERLESMPEDTTLVATERSPGWFRVEHDCAAGANLRR